MIEAPSSVPATDSSALRTSLFTRITIAKRIFVLALLAGVGAGHGLAAPDDLYRSWMAMYDLKFADAHHIFDTWKQTHPADALGPASNAAGYLFAELARLGALETELFVDDARFKGRAKLRPDAAAGSAFLKEVANAEHLADTALDASATDTNALFVKSLTLGLRADYAGLIEKQNLAALTYTKEGRAFAERALAADPNDLDAYLGPGIENYLLSLKAAPVRFLLRMTGSNVDRDKGVEEIRRTAQGGHYLEPFAKLLLAVAALRDRNPLQARDILRGLHNRFPDNELYLRELNRILSQAGLKPDRIPAPPARPQ